MYFQLDKNNIMTENNSKRNSDVKSDVNQQISNEAKKRRREQQNSVYNKEHLTITADRSFVQFCTGNAVILIEKKVLQTNGRGQI